MDDEQQELLDRFYWRHGPCCAGCDWWRSISSLVGGCTRSAPTSGAERAAALGMQSCSIVIPAGHVATTRDHVCGEFRDKFDWSSLPLAYQKRVGVPA